MSEQFYYSAKTGGFYPESGKASYEASANGWPADAITITNDEYKALFEGQAKGKIITADSNGKPVLADPPPPTPQELQAYADAQKEQLMTQALVAMLPLQSAVKLKMATDEEAVQLSAWEKYTVLLNRVDSVNPEWPEVPSGN